MAEKWTDRISAFFRSPCRFISSTSADTFLSELLSELRDDKVTYTTKVLLLSPLCEHPSLLCSSQSVGEETLVELLSIFVHCPPKCLQFRNHLLVALTSVFICTSCVSKEVHLCEDFLDLLLQLVQDTSDLHCDLLLGATACECLRELEACCPGLLSQRLELIGGLWSKESSRLHQAYAGLHTLVLRNCVYQLARDPASGDDHLHTLLGLNAFASRDADQEVVEIKKDSSIFSSLIRTHMDTVAILQTGRDCKDLRWVLSSNLENCFLLTPLYQATVLHRLMEVVAMVPAVPPSIFRSQLLRLLGTSEVCLLHSTLLMKCVYTDSLFSTDDEAFLLRRLVVLSQHPLLRKPQKLFFMDYILHFPENRPIGCGDGTENVPVLLTPHLGSTLAPTVLNDEASMLARFNLLALIYQEEAEKDGGEESKGMLYLYQHLSSLFHVVEKGCSREIVVTFFRAVFLFLLYFCPVEKYSHRIADQLCKLYRRRAHLVPHILNLADQAADVFPECRWVARLCAALRGTVIEAQASGFTLQDLTWHLKVLARVAEEDQIPQRSTLNLLSNMIMAPSSTLSTSSDWRLGNAVLGVCRRLMTHSSLGSLFIPLANILQHVACCYGDADIEDHARLYYTLLTTLCKDKMSAIVAQDVRERGQQIKQRSLSCIMADSERLTVHQTDQAVFRLVEVQNQTHLEGEPTSKETENCSGLEAYRDQFKDPCFGSQLVLYYQLSHAPFPNLPCFDEVFSICLHFSFRDEHYKELSDFNVPCLLRGRPPPVVKLSLKPRLPIPTSLCASAVFNTSNGLTWSTSLPDIHIVLQQMLVPLPVPTAWTSEDKVRVFESLWNEISAEEHADDASSLFCCQMQSREVEALVEKHFLPFVISRQPDRAQVNVLFFIPPQFHVLLKLISEEDAVQFNIATDNWRLLPHIRSFLCTFTSNL
ncbi:AP-5 complex subunit beta-1 [Dunckerocampus dactyliophorus]|uniref:AP-5 complex subunit beta-1 n=1 Tax=Dunckerocampus dactyliophorus TaxID=161453 RepID=UPI002405A5EC|nr:AP-5 complex subunit beta-1 [Dunckerocampus dactyliophorus]